MKTKLYIILFIIITLNICIILFISYPTKNKTNIPYYKNNLKDRYNSYKYKNPNLEEEEIITRVNLNLDKEPYTYINKSKYLDTSYILVNKYNYLDNNYKPNLILLNKCSLPNKYISNLAIKDFNDLCDESIKQGLKIRVISSYRSYNYQYNLYNNYVKKDGIKLADTYSARPGFSEHQTGLVIDIDNYNNDYNNFENTNEYNWMINNSYKYGFILRYPLNKEDITLYKYESWHYRYVGKEIAYKIYSQGISFEEYYIKYIDT